MNIIVMNDFAYVNGGASQVALSSARGLVNRGHRVLLFTAVGPVAPELQNILNLEVHCLTQHEIVTDPNRLRAVVRGLWNREAATAFERTTRHLSPATTVVHLHSWCKALSSSVVRAALDRGFPIVLTMHDYFSACPTGVFFRYPEGELCQLRPMSLECIGTQCDSRNYGHKLWRVARHWMQEYPGHLPRGIEDFVSISDVSEDLLRDYLPEYAHIHRVPNPITVPHETATKPSLHSAFTFAGRLTPEKGPMLLALAAKRHHLPVRFVGQGIEQEELARIAPHAEFTGWLDSTGVRKALRHSRALVFSSIWYETQGLVVAEAAALGLPAIVPSESAAREWVEDGVTGLIFRHGDAEDLASKMLLLHHDPAMADAMGEAAYRRYWDAPATTEHHCANLEEVYREMLERNRKLQEAAR